MNHTDLKLLRILLSLTSKLTKSEKGAFQAMYDDLANGKIVRLSKKQRQWLEAVYYHHNLHQKPITLKKITTKDKVKGVLDLGPLPLKPPGR